MVASTISLHDALHSPSSITTTQNQAQHGEIQNVHIIEWQTNVEKSIESPHNRHTESNRFTTYVLQVQCQSGQVYLLEKRYREFHALHAKLKRQFTTVKHLYFPPKHFFQSLALRVIELRQHHLEQYLAAILTLRPRPAAIELFLAPVSSQPSSSTSSGDREPRGRKLKLTESLSDSAAMIMAEGAKVYQSITPGTDKAGPCLITPQEFVAVKLLGKGSFGKVYLVQQQPSRKLFAMKVLAKSLLYERHQIDHTKMERQIMAIVDHPFIVQLYCAFQTPSHLFMVSNYCSGGELFFHFKKLRTFTESMVRFYAAELVCALEYLHESLGVIYRDLKPENILLDHLGHVQLTDFGLSKTKVSTFRGSSTFCGTPEYLAPEVLLAREAQSKAQKSQGSRTTTPHERGSEEYGFAIDWWSLGTIIYELLTGWPPFFDSKVSLMCQKILYGELTFPAEAHLSMDVQSLISSLLAKDPRARLGCQGAGARDIKEHAFFQSLDWAKVLKKEIKPCFRPPARSLTSNFERQFTQERPSMSPFQEESFVPRGSDPFSNFYFTRADHEDVFDADEERKVNLSNSIS